MNRQRPIQHPKTRLWDGIFLSPITEFKVTLGSASFSLSSSGFNGIRIGNASSFGFDSISFNASLVGPGAIGTIPAELLLMDQNRSVFTSDALPVALNLSDFDSPVRLVLGSKRFRLFCKRNPFD